MVLEASGIIFLFLDEWELIFYKDGTQNKNFKGDLPHGRAFQP
jgi:hypothetical protein